MGAVPAGPRRRIGPDGEGGAALMDLRVLSVKEHYPQALAVAREWRSDAMLNLAIAYFHAADEPRDLSISYFFNSAGPPPLWLTVRLKQLDTALVVQVEEGVLG